MDSLLKHTRVFKAYSCMNTATDMFYIALAIERSVSIEILLERCFEDLKFGDLVTTNSFNAHQSREVSGI